MTRGFCSLFLYGLLSLFLCQGSKTEKFFTKNKIIAVSVFAVVDILLFIIQMIFVSSIHFDQKAWANEYTFSDDKSVRNNIDLFLFYLTLLAIDLWVCAGFILRGIRQGSITRKNDIVEIENLNKITFKSIRDTHLAKDRELSDLSDRES